MENDNSPSLENTLYKTHINHVHLINKSCSINYALEKGAKICIIKLSFILCIIWYHHNW